VKFGLLLPHFGRECTHDRIFKQISYIEEAGFNSVWVRDHLMFQPHEFEGKQDSIFLEPFTTLAGLAALTKKIQLGTATVVTYRHPLVTSQLFGTLSYIANGRVIAGIGAGTPRSPYDAVGLPYEKRGKVVDELIEILKKTWTEKDVSYNGEIYQFKNVTLDPVPPTGTPIYYGGHTPPALRRTAKYCDGWLPQRTPFLVLDQLIDRLRIEEENYNRSDKPVKISYFPLSNIDKNSQVAKEEISFDKLLNNLGHMIVEKGWDKFGMSEAKEENLDGVYIAGSPNEVIDQIQPFIDRGIDEIVFDLRNTFNLWEEKVELLSTYVLPAFTN